ncbi:MAG: hypothetical protein ACRD4B_09555 [Acidobacteriota bacterium]
MEFDVQTVAGLATGSAVGGGFGAWVTLRIMLEAVKADVRSINKDLDKITMRVDQNIRDITNLRIHTRMVSKDWEQAK